MDGRLLVSRRVRLGLCVGRRGRIFRMVLFIRRVALDVLFGVVLLFRGLLCSVFRVVGWLTLLCLLLPSLLTPPLALEDRAKCPIIGRGAACDIVLR